MQKTNIRQILFHVRYLYILAYVLFTLLNKFIPFVVNVGAAVSVICYNSLAIFGAVLLAADFFTRRNMFRVRYNGLLLLFFCVYVLSMVYNIRFGWVDNAKTLAWMLIQTFLLMAMDLEQTYDAHNKHLNVIFNAYIVIWFVAVVISLGQFVTQYFAAHDLAGDSVPEGFLDGRLYGIFTDPNVGAVCAIIALLLAAFQMKSRSQGVLLRTFYWITIVSNVIYVVLSGSRTGELILLGLAALIPVFAGICKAYADGTKWFVKALRQGLLVVLCVALTFGGMKVLKAGLPYVPRLYHHVQPQVQPQVQDNSKPTNPVDDIEMTAPATEETESAEGEIAVSLERPDVVDSDDISNSRFKIWADALKLFRVSPLLGTSPRNHLAFAESHFGPEMYMVRRGYSVHNGYLSLLVHTGVLGAGTMLLWMACVVVYVFGYLIRRRKTQDQYYKPVMYMTLVLFAIAVSAFPMMGIFFGNSVIEVLFWLITGYTLYLIRVSEQNENTKEPVLYRISEAMIHKFSKKRTK